MKDFKRGFVGFFDDVLPDGEFLGFVCAYILVFVGSLVCFMGAVFVAIRFFST